MVRRRTTGKPPAAQRQRDVLGSVDQEDMIEAHPGPLDDPIEDLDLLGRPGKSVEQEPLGGDRAVRQRLFHELAHQLVGDEPARGHDVLDAAAER